MITPLLRLMNAECNQTSLRKQKTDCVVMGGRSLRDSLAMIRRGCVWQQETTLLKSSGVRAYNLCMFLDELTMVEPFPSAKFSERTVNSIECGEKYSQGILIKKTRLSVSKSGRV